MFVVKVTESMVISYTSFNRLRHIGGEVICEIIKEQERCLFKSHTLYMVRENKQGPPERDRVRQLFHCLVLNLDTSLKSSD